VIRALIAAARWLFAPMTEQDREDLQAW